MNDQLRTELLERMVKEQKLRTDLIDNPDDIQLMMRMLEADAPPSVTIMMRHWYPIV